MKVGAVIVGGTVQRSTAPPPENEILKAPRPANVAGLPSELTKRCMFKAGKPISGTPAIVAKDSHAASQAAQASFSSVSSMSGVRMSPVSPGPTPFGRGSAMIGNDALPNTDQANALRNVI